MNVTGDCNPAKLGTHFRGLEGLKKGAGGAEISSVSRQIALEAGRHGKTIGKDLSRLKWTAPATTIARTILKMARK